MLLDPDVQDLVMLFNQCFEASEQTILKSGGSEPVYQPNGWPDACAEIISTRDYFSSALHEISHWCIAGTARRQQVDYGYWYEPDGRTEAQQVAFEKVEIKPQALEWIFTHACGQRFRLSADNLNNPDAGASDEFKRNVSHQAKTYIAAGLKGRAGVFFDALKGHFSPDASEIGENDFCVEKL